MLAPDRLLDQRQPGDVLGEVAAREVRRRKSMRLTQRQLAERSGVSLASVRRFEQGHEIALASLVAIGFALDCEDDFDALFAQPHYASIEDVVRAGREGGRGRLSAKGDAGGRPAGPGMGATRAAGQATGRGGAS